jgi:hypothetical protein
MNYWTLFSPAQITLLSNWLGEAHELYVDIHLPHSGSSSTAYFVRSITDLKHLIEQQIHPEIRITIFRHVQYPIRGIANNDLLDQALQQIKNGDWYSIISLAHYFPQSCRFFGSGNSHQELKQEFTEIVGELVGIGINPFDVYDEEWLNSRPDEVLTLSSTKTRLD